jgi:hypothetical protein
MKRNKNVKKQTQEYIDLMFTPMLRILSGGNMILISKAVEEFRGKIRKVSLLVALYLPDLIRKRYHDATSEFYEFKNGLNSKIVADLLRMLGDDLVSFNNNQGMANIDQSVPRDIACVVEIVKNLKFKNPRSRVDEIS